MNSRLVCTGQEVRRLVVALAALCAFTAEGGAGAADPPSAAAPAADAPAASAVTVSVTPDHPDGFYRVGDKMGWTLTLPAGSDSTGYRFVAKENGQAVLMGGVLTFKEGKARIEMMAAEPAMVLVEVTPPGADAKPISLGAAIEPQRLRPVVDRPADFTSFWRAKLHALAAVPVNPVLTSGPSDKDGVDYATIVMDTVDGAHIHGQVARSKAGAKLPGLVIFQWAGGPYPLQKQWVTDRAAQGWLALNSEPHDVLPDQPQSYYDQLPAELKSYHKIGLKDRDKSYFLRMYLSDYRAIEYLASRPDWDGKTLVVMGTSMGGQQSLCAAGLNHRVTALIVNEPSGADSNGQLYGRLTGYPNWPSDEPDAMRTALYFDTVNCARDIRAPSLVAMGFIDPVAPPAGIWTAFNEIKAPKEAAPMVDSPHNSQATPAQQRPYVERAEQWLEALRTTGKPPSATSLRRPD